MERRPPALVHRVERARRVVSHCSQAAIRAYDEEALLAEACRYLVDEGDYCLAWFGEAEAPGKPLRTLAQAGTEPSGSVRSEALPRTTGLGVRSPTMRALLEQRPHVVRAIPSDPLLEQRFPDAAPLGYAAICAFPVQFGPHGSGVLTIHAREPDAFAPEEVALLRELAGDMAVGVSGLRARRANDVLEEKLEVAEFRFRSIIENAPVGVFQADLEGCLVLANRALATMLGYDTPDELMDLGTQALLRHVAPEDLQRIRTAMGRTSPDNPLKLTLRRRDGTSLPAEISVKPANGYTKDAIEAFVRDLTGEHAAQAIRLAQERQRLEVVRLQELAAMRADFLGRASHELNTPLTPILLQVQALRGPGLDANLERGLALIERNVLRLAALVKDLLSASTLQSGRIALHPAPIDLAQKVAGVVESFQAQARKVGVVLQAQGSNVEAFADAGAITQVLYNLVSNAIKFTPRGGTVTVRCEASGDQARCVVVDTGCGFTAVQQKLLFLPFGRAHDTQTGDPGGTGLGLFISKGIIEHSGGALSCTSPGPELGATFTFTLPARRPAAAPTPGRGIRAATGFTTPAAATGDEPEAATDDAPAAEAPPANGAALAPTLQAA